MAKQVCPQLEILVVEVLKRQDRPIGVDADAAVKRVSVDAGRVVRRCIVLAILFGTILAPFILPFFGIPVVVELTERKYAPFDLFGLFGTAETTSFEVVRGYLFTEENRQILVTIVGFYFGAAVGKSR